MNTKQIRKIKKHLAVKNGQVTTTSLDVANFFGKKHKHVMEAINDLGCPSDFTGPNFRPSEYKDPTGRKLPMIEMTRKGFVLLAMGFTGPRAMEFKIAYIEAFDQMEKKLARSSALEDGRRMDALLGVVASAARAGHASDFLPRMVHLRRAGLSCSEVSKVLGVSRSTINAWSSRLRRVGFDLPNLKNLPSHMQGAGRQLPLLDEACA